MILSSALESSSEWQEELVIDSRYVATSVIDFENTNLTLSGRYAHIDQVHRLAWRPGADRMAKELASCSEDGTVKVLRVHIGSG